MLRSSRHYITMAYSSRRRTAPLSLNLSTTLSCVTALNIGCLMTSNKNCTKMATRKGQTHRSDTQSVITAAQQLCGPCCLFIPHFSKAQWRCANLYQTLGANTCQIKRFRVLQWPLYADSVTMLDILHLTSLSSNIPPSPLYF